MMSIVTNEHPIATREATISAILAESLRPGKVPLRNTFLQGGRRGAPAPGPLAEFVRRGRDTALEQFLLLLTWASGEPHNVRRDSRIWARALGMDGDTSGRAAVSRNWRFMKDLDLILPSRSARLANILLLAEDGSGKPYSHPGRKNEPYFKLPFAYWEHGYHKRLSLAAKAMLLIGLSLPDRYPLPAERTHGWYGISESTTRRGLRELREADVLTRVKIEKAAPLAPKGYTLVNLYTLLPPFGPKSSSPSDSQDG